jgi:hypothetical protein
VVLRGALSNPSSAFATLLPLDKVMLTDAVAAQISQLSVGKRKNYRPNRRLTAAERTELAAQYRDGKSAFELARQYGINRHTVTKHLQREGVIIRGSQVKMTPELIAKAAYLYASGQSLVKVGAHLSVDPTTVHKALKNAGMNMRDSHGRPNCGRMIPNPTVP